MRLRMEKVKVKTMIKLIIRDRTHIKHVKNILEEHKWLNKSKKIDNHQGIFTIYTTLTLLPAILSGYEYGEYEETPNQEGTGKKTLQFIVEEYCVRNGIDVLEFPKRWSLYPPMLLFNSSLTFSSNTNTNTNTNTNLNGDISLPSELCEELLKNQLDLFGTCNITHIAINKPIIESDIMRRPHNIVPLYGDFGPRLPLEDYRPTAKDFQNAFWCHVVQNGIWQTWAPLYTMFSRGNIKEKKRILDNYKNLQGTVVMDLYCGIGYFSLSYLRNGAKLLCWELNPWSVEGFCRAMEHAGYKYRLFQETDTFDIIALNEVDACVFLESNEKVLNRLQNVQRHSLRISHINLGLLPTSQPSWPIVNEVVHIYSNTDPLVHVHENVHVEDFEKLGKKIEANFTRGEVIHQEKVKTFAPDVWHVVYDVRVRK